ncbi:MAG: DUF6273 domain-containing protein [Christensenellales bacterium]
MGLFKKKTKKVIIGNTSCVSVDKDTIAFPSDQELFPDLFEENEQRFFHSYYAKKLKRALTEGLFSFPEKTEKQNAAYREKEYLTKNEMNSFLLPYKSSVHQLWISLEKELKTDIERGTIDSFPVQYHSFHVFRWGDEMKKIELRYFDELTRAISGDVNDWPWYRVTEPIWKRPSVLDPNKKEILAVLDRAYRLLRYYTLWNSTLPAPHEIVHEMQAEFSDILQFFGVKKEDCEFLFSVPELPEDLMAESEPLVPHYYAQRTPPELFPFLTPGDTLRFGSYPYEEDGRPRTIEWGIKMVSSKEGWADVYSSFCLDVMPFHHEQKDIIRWNNCDLRAWLNDSFYKAAFTEEERQYIVKNDVPYDRNFNLTKNLSTQDYIYIPNNYFRFDLRAQMINPAVPLTPYAFSKVKKLGLFRHLNCHTCESGWWTRTICCNQENLGKVFIINGDGIETSEQMDSNVPVRVMLRLSFNPVNEQ